VLFLPLYTPVRTDMPVPETGRVFYGGINSWLQQKFAVFRRLPRFVDWVFDRPALLKLVSRFAIDTDPQDLGPMTVSVLRGEDGNQRKELGELIDFLAQGERPDVVNLTNSLLSAVTPALKKRLGVPVVCTLQGEEGFVAELGDPYRGQAEALIRQHARLIDLFLAPSEGYAEVATGVLGVGRDRIRVVPPGIEVAPYANAQPRVRQPFRVGFLSRIARVKGIDILCHAFRRLCETMNGDAVLAVAGQRFGRDRRLWRILLDELRGQGLGDRVEFHGEVDLSEKAAFLKSCSAFCLPSRMVERRGVAVLEAMAAGVPVVVPNRGVFPELLAHTSAGVAVAPEDPQAIADALLPLYENPDEADRMGRAGAGAVADRYSAEAMAAETLRAYEEAIAAAALE
jgi:glycosyltransferase involved in cell wall biosynthesis